MKVFIVYCHPSEDSFTRNVRDAFIKGLGVIGTTYGYLFQKAGHTVEHYLRPGSPKAGIRQFKDYLFKRGFVWSEQQKQFRPIGIPRLDDVYRHGSCQDVGHGMGDILKD